MLKGGNAKKILTTWLYWNKYRWERGDSRLL